MRTTIDRAGRVVIPKAMRERLGLLDGGEVEIVATADGVELTVPPAITEVRIVDGLPEFAADRHVPELTEDVVRATLESVRR